MNTATEKRDPALRADALRRPAARARRAPRGPRMLAWVAIGAAALATIVFSHRVGRAQDEPAANPAPAAGDAEGEGAAARKPTGKSKAQNDPLLQSLAEFTTDTPQDLTRAIKILVDVQKPDLANDYLKRLIALNPSPGDSDQLLEKFGSDLFMAVSQTPELAEIARPFVAKLMAQAEAFRQDPDRLAKMIEALRSPDRYTRLTALRQLQRSGQAAAVTMISVLADPGRAAEHGVVAAALAEMGSDAILPARGALETSDPDFRRQIMLLLARLGDRQATDLMVRAAVDPQSDAALAEAARAAIGMLSGSTVDLNTGRKVIEREIAAQLAAAVRERRDAEPSAEIWRWDETKKLAYPVAAPRAVAFADRAARLAIDLQALDAGEHPVEPSSLRLALISRLTAAKLSQDLDAPLPAGEGTAHDAAVAAGADAVDQALGAALAGDNPIAAAAAAEILGEIGSPDLLTRRGPQPAPLASALESPYRRVRFAALKAVIAIAPATRFAGDGYLSTSLGYFASTSGVGRVLIGHPRLDMAQLLAGLLAANGYETDVVTTGRDAFRLATTSPDYDFILLHHLLRGPQLDDLLTSLRRDPTTRRTPIGILALARDRAIVVGAAQIPGEANKPILRQGLRKLGQPTGAPKKESQNEVPNWETVDGTILQVGAATDQADLVKADDGTLLRLGFVPDANATRIAASAPPALAMIEPGAALAMKLRSEELMRLVGRDHVPLAERQREAAQAVGWIGQLAEKAKNVRDMKPLAPILVRLLTVPTLEEAAADAIEHVGGPQCEQALLEVVNSSIQPMPSRQVAAAVFGRCVLRYGVLLNSAEIARQYQLYNASAADTPETQKLLSLVLDAVEGKAPGGEPEPAAPAKNP